MADAGAFGRKSDLKDLTAGGYNQTRRASFGGGANKSRDGYTHARETEKDEFKSEQRPSKWLLNCVFRHRQLLVVCVKVNPGVGTRYIHLELPANLGPSVGLSCSPYTSSFNQ